MIKVTAYGEIDRLPAWIVPYIQGRYRQIHACYLPDVPLERHNLKGAGQFVWIEKSEELDDLSVFSLYGGLEEQNIEFVKCIPATSPNCYEVCILVNTDCAVSLLCCEDTLTSRQKAKIKEAIGNA